MGPDYEGSRKPRRGILPRYGADCELTVGGQTRRSDQRGWHFRKAGLGLGDTLDTDWEGSAVGPPRRHVTHPRFQPTVEMDPMDTEGRL